MEKNTTMEEKNTTMVSIPLTGKDTESVAGITNTSTSNKDIPSTHTNNNRNKKFNASDTDSESYNNSSSSSNIDSKSLLSIDGVKQIFNLARIRRTFVSAMLLSIVVLIYEYKPVIQFLDNIIRDSEKRGRDLETYYKTIIQDIIARNMNMTKIMKD